MDFCGLIKGQLVTSDHSFDLIGPNDLTSVAKIPALNQEHIATAFQAARDSQAS